MDTTNSNPESNGDERCQIETAFVRETGCGIRYVVSFEDIDENEYQIYLDRTAAEKLYSILTNLLNKNTFTIPATNPNPPPVPVQPNPWNTAPPAPLRPLNYPFTWLGIYPRF